jgi:hypothetical protein
VIFVAGTEFLCEDVEFARRMRDACESAVLKQTVSFAGGMKATYFACRTDIALMLVIL